MRGEGFYGITNFKISTFAPLSGLLRPTHHNPQPTPNIHTTPDNKTQKKKKMVRPEKFPTYEDFADSREVRNLIVAYRNKELTTQEALHSMVKRAFEVDGKEYSRSKFLRHLEQYNKENPPFFYTPQGKQHGYEASSMTS